MLTIPDRYDPEIENLYGSLKSYKGDIFINHRLDKDTSGLILFSKTEEAHKTMSAQFENREIEKIYLAILTNTPDIESGKIDMPISKSNSVKKGVVIDPKGKEAITYYQVVESFARHALVRLKIETGRMHQIRVHMKSIYCPLVCDNIYGDGRPFLLSHVKHKYKRNKHDVERPLLSRVGLHSHRLSIKHPESGEEMCFEQELPKDMRAVVNQLRKLA